METSGSPQGGPKRACEASATEARESRDGSNAAGASGNQPLTLALLQQALQVNQQQITSCLQESLSGLGNRVGRVEQQLDEHVQRSTDLFDVMTSEAERRGKGRLSRGGAEDKKEKGLTEGPPRA